MNKPEPALQIATATDPGIVRSHNEDSLAADSEFGLAVLADGMGGYNAGEVASGIAVAMISSDMKRALQGVDRESLDDRVAESLIRDHAVRANAAIYQAAQGETRYSGMGTTLVIALWHDRRVTVGHIGDSRLYRLRGEAFEQITRDHSVLQEQIDSGMITREEARYSRNKNLVTRALGIDPHVEAEVHSYAVDPGDVYLLCSDGLSDMVAEPTMQSILSSAGRNLPLAAERLVREANENGGRDNISVILARASEKSMAPPGRWDKLKAWFG